MALTKRRQLFVTEYLANPKQPAAWSAVRAGFSQKRARETGSELLKDPGIKAAIEHRLMKRLEKRSKSQVQLERKEDMKSTRPSLARLRRRAGHVVRGRGCATVGSRSGRGRNVRKWSKNMQVENQLGNCTIEYAASWSDQSLPCGKRAVARCADCGSSICSDCSLECCGRSFCGQCYDYHMKHICLRKPVQSGQGTQDRTEIA
jgi:hypothetical protein